MNKAASIAGIRLVVFDMDGTLTEELLDFDAIRRELGLNEGVGILEHIRHLSGDQRHQAEEILHRHEITAAQQCVLHPGAHHVLAELRTRGRKTALLTRNSAACAQSILTRHTLSLDHISTREDLPHKPHADSILNITRRFGFSPEQTLMVGDYLYDLQAAQAAGCPSALLWMKGGNLPDFAAMATRIITTLPEVLDLVGSHEGAHT